MSRLTIARHPLAAGLAAAALALAPSVAVAAQDTPSDVEAEAEAPLQTTGEKRLAKLLKGRVAGEPVSCIRTLPNQRMQTIDGTAYIYGQGSTIYVQRTRNPERIDDNDALVTNRVNATQLCRMDITTTIDPLTGIFSGAVFFDDFVPYTRIKTEAPAEG
ncbi:MAG: hypothetical protein NWS68_06025 [Erythrobacter sp.]|nr:hypothetical protein [Erythrobacter sp.]